MKKAQMIIEESTTKRLVYAISVQYLLARAVHVAVDLDLANNLPEEPTALEAIIQNYPGFTKNRLARLLDYLANHGFCTTKDGKYCINDLGRELKRDHRHLFVSKEEWCQYAEFWQSIDNTVDDLSVLEKSGLLLELSMTGLNIMGEPHEIAMLSSRFHLISRALHAAAQVGIAQYLNEGETLILSEFKHETISVEQLTILLRWLQLLRLAEKVDDSWRFSRQLVMTLSETEQTLVPAFIMVDAAWWGSVSELGYALLEGKAAFDKVNGQSFFGYLSNNPLAQSCFDRGLGCFSKEDDGQVVQSYDFSGYPSIVDIGGGYGGLSLELLKSCNETLEDLFLFEREEALKNIHPQLSEEPWEKRFHPAAGDFFKPMAEQGLPREKSLYLIKGVLHDFNDEQVKEVLNNVHDVMSDDSELLVVERSLRDDNSSHVNFSADLLMLALLNGRERSLKDWVDLFQYAHLFCTNADRPINAGDFSLLKCKRYQPTLFANTKGVVDQSAEEEKSTSPRLETFF